VGKGEERKKERQKKENAREERVGSRRRNIPAIFKS